MRVLVVGATGGTGRATVEALLRRGHDVTAFARRPDAVVPSSARLRIFRGDAMRLADVEEAVRGHDAVIVTLGIRENPLAVRLRGSVGTAMNVRSSGLTRLLVQPVGLTDGPEIGEPFASTAGEGRGMAIPRRSVATFLESVINPAWARQCVALSV